MDCERRRVGHDGVLSTGFLDLPPVLLIKILSKVNGPVNERVRASRTCKAFYEVLSGPHAFSNVKKLPHNPEREQFDPQFNLSGEQFDKILNSEKDTNTRSAMAKRLRSSVTSMDLDLSETPLLSEQLMFVSEFQNLTTLEISLVGNVEDFDVRSSPVQPDKLQVSTLLVKVTWDQSKSLAITLNVLECILDFSAVTDLTVLLYCNLSGSAYGSKSDDIDLRPLLEHDFENLQKIVLRGYYVGTREALEYLPFRTDTGHALDFIQQQRFEKLTCLQLLFRPQSLTSVIGFIKGRPAGMPKLRLECVVKRQGNETEEQKEELRRLISSESNVFNFFGVMIYE